MVDDNVCTCSYSVYEQLENGSFGFLFELIVAKADVDARLEGLIKGLDSRSVHCLMASVGGSIPRPGWSSETEYLGSILAGAGKH